MVPNRAHNNDDQSKLRMAISLHQEGRLDQAAALYDELLSSHPGNFFALHYLGIIEANRGNISRAKLLMGRSLSIEPSKGLQSNSTSIPLLYICAVALYKLDRMREALDRFDSSPPLMNEDLSLRQ